MPRRKKSDKEKSRTFDCLGCGSVFWVKANSFTCPTCNLPTRLRPTGTEHPPYWLKQTCSVCPETCRYCAEGLAWAADEIARLQQGDEITQWPSDGPETRVELLTLF